MLIKGKTYQNPDTGRIESVGEKENKISILSHNKNLVNPNKLFLNINLVYSFVIFVPIGILVSLTLLPVFT